ncbi:fibronectin type III domain-containing protein, partial [Lentilactobacillus rapi]|uniref:fibronectin type III domain-containing protein n=1 Tax=Lentilactobacillus rapi TaxID=481723 RepID=UPI001FB24970
MSTTLAKKGFDYTVTAPESDGGSEITGYSLEYQKQGGTDWTKVALNPDSLTGTVTDGIEAGSDYLFRVNAENAVGSSDYFTVSDPLPTVDGNIYGVSWDGSSSGALQRTDAAVGLKAGINGTQNDFDTRGPWGLMDKTVTDSYGNAFVRVPKFYIRKTQDKNKPLSTWQVSLVKQGDDWYLPNCFYDFDDKKELDYVDVSRYEGSVISGKLQSKTGVEPTTNQTIVQLRSSAVANNTDGKKGYHLWDVHTLDALQVLFTIEFATLDSQSIMEGNDSGSSLINTGTTDNVKGSSGFVTSGSTPMAYRGIENLYGNLAMWTDGLNISNLSLYSCDDATKYASDVFTSPYYMLNYSLQSMTSGNSNITGLGFDKDHPSVEAPASSNNDQYNTYYHDYCYVNGSGNYVVDTGGSWDWGAG